jgi:hypothetical protein
MTKVCVRTQIVVRRVQRHRITRRVTKHVIHGTTVGFVPSAVNDVIFHHANIGLEEVVHATQDTLAVSILSALRFFLM